MPDRFLTLLARSLPATVPFVGPEAQERARGSAFTARLGANESGFGPPAAAIAAMEQAASEVWMYGDPEAHELRQAIARHHGVAPDAVMIGEGIDGLLGTLVRLTVAAGDPVVTSDGAYPTFAFHVTGHGGRLHKVPYRDGAEDPEALAEAARAVDAKLVYFANPDNPMGSWHGADRVSALIDALPRDSLLVLDEAYVDFAPEGTAPPFDTDRANVIRFRTFSKAWGMAGARVGYAIGHPGLIAAFDRVRNHFGMGRVVQAGALAALSDQVHLARVRGLVAAARERIGQIGRGHGLMPLPSATNFVALDTGRDGAFARALVAALGRRGVFVRMPGVAPLDRSIRVSCGPDAALHRFAAALPDALAEAMASQR